jgi:hypothetical protein
MTKKEFNARVQEMCEFVKAHKYDAIGGELIQRNIRDPFTYGAWCERNFEMNLREDYERKTTYTSDFSIAEWCVPVEGMSAIASTLRNALTNWRDNVEWFAEILLVINLKSWEHAARGNNEYGKMYSELFYMVQALYFDWFDESNKKHGEAMEYYYQYVD